MDGYDPVNVAEHLNYLTTGWSDLTMTIFTFKQLFQKNTNVANPMQTNHPLFKTTRTC